MDLLLTLFVRSYLSQGRRGVPETRALLVSLDGTAKGNEGTPETGVVFVGADKLAKVWVGWWLGRVTQWIGVSS
jgi:hypothetical protein